MGTFKRRLAKSAGAVLSACAFGTAAVIIHHELKGYHLQDIASQFHQIATAAVVIASLLTLLDYFVLTGSDALAMRYIRQPLAYHRLAFASFVGYVFSNNATLIGGSAVRYRVYSTLGVSAREVAEVVLFCGVGFWLGFLTLLGAVLALERRSVPVPQHLHLPFLSPWIIGALCLTLVAAYLLMVVVRRRPLNFFGWQLSMPSVPLVVGQIAISVLDWLLAAAVLYMLLPRGIEVTFGTFVGIFMLAQAAGMLSYVPGGLGVFETVLLLSLADGGDAAALTAALLLYRLVYYLLPLLLASILLAIHELMPHIAAIRQIGWRLGRWGTILIPQVFALAVFVAGAVLLFSGVLPPVKSRFEIVRDLFPLPVIELSHFLGSLTGAALLILARGLQRRLDGAYHTTVILLGAGMVFSLLKGLDYEEATIMAVMLATLLPCRHQFYRKTSLIAQRFSSGWIAMIAIVLICSVWLGLFAYKHVEYSSELWWRFALHGDASRFLRATVGSIALIFLYAVTKLFIAARPEPVAMDQTAMATVETIVGRSPKSYANLALLGDKQFLLSKDKDAFIMYAVEGRSWIAMGDPVGPRQTWQELIWRFVELCDQYDGLPAFYQVDAQSFDLYTNLGMTFQKFGEEARIPLASFSLEGGGRKNLRYAVNKSSKQGYRFEVLRREQVPSVMDQLQFVSDTWLRDKNTREKGFSLGFFRPDYIARFPLAVVRRDDKIVAFANVWTTADKQELSVDLMRHLPDCLDTIMDYLFVEITLWGRQENYQWFNLGMAPLSGLAEHALAPFWSKAGAMVFRHGEHFYNFQGLRQYKEKFTPQWQPKYLVCRGGLALPRILTNLATLISGGIGGIVTK